MTWQPRPAKAVDAFARWPKRARTMDSECRNRSSSVTSSPSTGWSCADELLGIVNTSEDSLRFYPLDENVRRRIEHFGINEPVDFEGPLIF